MVRPQIWARANKKQKTFGRGRVYIRLHFINRSELEMDLEERQIPFNNSIHDILLHFPLLWS